MNYHNDHNDHNDHNGQIGSVPGSRSRLTAGLELLEEWAEGAGQAAKNVMYEALFAITDGSFRDSYEFVDHQTRPGEFTVLVKDNLVVRVRVQDGGGFGICSIGRIGDAAG